MKEKTAILVRKLYRIVSELESIHPGRTFTPDGHLVGSIGECLIANRLELQLLPPSNKGFDALDKTGRKIEIKVTQGKYVAFRHEPEFALVGLLDKSGQVSIVYNGPGKLIWNEFKGKKMPSNGQYRIGIKRLTELICNS